MGLLFFGRNKVQIDDQIILRAKQDAFVREELIASHRVWILRVVGRATRRYIGERDDEFSIAVMAFDEAITSYEGDRLASFLTFAEHVIRRRLIDWQRKESRRPEVVWSEVAPGGEDGLSEEQLLGPASLMAHHMAEEVNARRSEIERLNDELIPYKVSFAELAEVSPKHRDARVAAMRVAQLLANRSNLLARLQDSKGLPLRDLQEVADVSRKTLERQRKYIITLTIILVGDFPMIRSFIEWPKGGGANVKT